MGYLLSAYAIILLVIAGYVLVLYRRKKDIERDVDLLRQAKREA